jgi:hypothetical protein
MAHTLSDPLFNASTHEMKTLVVPVLLVVGMGFAAPAQAGPGDQNDAEQAVAAVYNQVQHGRTPSMPPSFSQ